MASHLRRRRLAARAGSAATFVLVVVACVTSVAATGDGSSFLHGLEARQAGAAVQITSDLWAKCRQPVPCAENQNITAKYDVDACVAVAKRWGTDESEDVASYEAIGPYTANNVTNCQVFVSNLGAPSITFSRKDMAAAIERLSAQCVQESAAHNSVICDMDYNGGSVHLEVLPLGEQDMIAPVTGTGSAAGAGADTAAAAATDSTGSTTDSGSKSPTSTDSLGAQTGAGLSDGASSATDPASLTTSTSSATETTPDSSSGASTPSSDSASGASETAGTGTTDTNDLGTTGSTRRRARALETSRVYPTVRPRRIALPSWTL